VSEPFLDLSAQNFALLIYLLNIGRTKLDLVLSVGFLQQTSRLRDLTRPSFLFLLPDAPQIFSSIGLKGNSVGLLASGICELSLLYPAGSVSFDTRSTPLLFFADGVVKIVATSIFIFVGIEKIGRKKALGFGGAGMSMFLFVSLQVDNTARIFPEPRC